MRFTLVEFTKEIFNRCSATRYVSGFCVYCDKYVLNEECDKCRKFSVFVEYSYRRRPYATLWNVYYTDMLNMGAEV